MNIDRRSFLGSGLAAWGAARIAPSPVAATAAGQTAAARASSGRSLSRQFAQWVVGLRYEDLPAAVVDRVKGLTLQNLASALVGVRVACGPAGGGARDRRRNGRAKRRHHSGERKQGDQGRRRLCELGTDAGGRKVGHLPHAHAPRHGDHPGRPGCRGGGRGVGSRLHHRRGGRLRGHGTDGRRLDSDRHGARVPRRTGVQHLWRRRRRREDHALHRRPGPRHDLTLYESGGQQPRKPRPARGRRRPQRHARGLARKAGEGRRWRGGSRRSGRVLSRLRRQPHGPSHLQLRRRHGNQPRRAHGQPRHGLDAARDAVPDLLDFRLQHRPHRRHGEALRRAQHQVRGRRARGGRRELAGNAISQSRLPDSGEKTPASRRAAARGITRRTASSSAVSRCWPSRPIRPRCSS